MFDSSRTVRALLTVFTIGTLGAVALAQASESQPVTIVLPPPTGPHGVGTALWHWIDANRPDVSAGNEAPARELVAHLWYPADGGERAVTPYRPLSAGRFDHVRRHAVAGAPFSADAPPAPVIALCPGRGTSLFYYTSIAEDLASHGYAVLAVDSPSLGYVEFPDGRTIDPSDAYRPSFELITGPYEHVDRFFEPAVEIGLGDWRFALKQLAAVHADDPAKRLTGKLDLDRIGAFGHSLGGRICGALAAAHEKVVAFAAMEGVPPRAARRDGLPAASLMLYSSELPEQMALPNIREVFDNRIHDATILRLEGFGHNSVTDRPLLFADSFEYAVDPVEALAITRQLLCRFFTAYLRDGEFNPRAMAKSGLVTVIEAS